MLRECEQSKTPPSIIENKSVVLRECEQSKTPPSIIENKSVVLRANVKNFVDIE